jgi:hypothetical protein
VKVLFISHSNESSGFSYSGHAYIKALLSAGIDVVCRHIKLNNLNPEVPDFIKECEAKSVKGCTHVIQYVLPHFMSYVAGVKNIGICMYDLSSLKYCGWDRHLNCMDEVWIPEPWTPFLDEITQPTKYVPIPCDSSVYQRNYDLTKIPNVKGTCIFYTIADLCSRKNIRDFLIAFHTEFHSNEPVSIVIKSGSLDMSPQQTAQLISDNINQIKSDLKLYRRLEDYKQELLITDKIPFESICKIHNESYCFVNTSHGEGFSMPTFDAWAFGNNVIYYRSNEKSYAYLNHTNSNYPVNCEQTSCVGYTDTFYELGSARESWCGSNILGLRKAMRDVYNKWVSGVSKEKHSFYEEFSYEKVGNLMKGLL